MWSDSLVTLSSAKMTVMTYAFPSIQTSWKSIPSLRVQDAAASDGLRNFQPGYSTDQFTPHT